MLTCFHNSPGFVVGDLKQPDVLPVGEKDVGSCDAGVQAGQQHQPGHQPARGHAAALAAVWKGMGQIHPIMLLPLHAKCHSSFVTERHFTFLTPITESLPCVQQPGPCHSTLCS